MHTSHISSNNYTFPVNHHPWELKTPFIICLIMLSLHSAEDKLTINSFFFWERENSDAIHLMSISCSDNIFDLVFIASIYRLMVFQH